MKSDPSLHWAFLPVRFQSTLLVWRATYRFSIAGLSRHFNPRSSYEERQFLHPLVFSQCISIHAPRMKSDLRVTRESCTPRISIHAPRMKSDAAIFRFPTYSDFNPRSSYEERQLFGSSTKLTDISIHAPRMKSDLMRQSRHWLTEFQSTLLVWRATKNSW